MRRNAPSLPRRRWATRLTQQDYLRPVKAEGRASPCGDLGPLLSRWRLRPSGSARAEYEPAEGTRVPGLSGACRGRLRGPPRTGLRWSFDHGGVRRKRGFHRRGDGVACRAASAGGRCTAEDIAGELVELTRGHSQSEAAAPCTTRSSASPRRRGGRARGARWWACRDLAGPARRSHRGHMRGAGVATGRGVRQSPLAWTNPRTPRWIKGPRSSWHGTTRLAPSGAECS